MNLALTRAAQNYAQYMGAANFFDHYGPDGSTPWSRAEAEGYTGWTYMGENIAAGYATPAAVMAGWMNSPGHRANILEPGFRDIGVGYAYVPGSTYGYYWVQDFGSR